MDINRISEHDSELQKLHVLVASAAPTAPSKEDLARYSVELAQLVISLVDAGHLKSRRRYAMAKAVVAAAEADALIRAASGARA